MFNAVIYVNETRKIVQRMRCSELAQLRIQPVPAGCTMLEGFFSDGNTHKVVGHGDMCHTERMTDEEIERENARVRELKRKERKEQAAIAAANPVTEKGLTDLLKRVEGIEAILASGNP